MLDSVECACPDTSPHEIRARFEAIVARIGAAPLSQEEEQHVYRALWALWCGIPDELRAPGDEVFPLSPTQAEHSGRHDWTIAGHRLWLKRGADSRWRRID